MGLLITLYRIIYFVVYRSTQLVVHTAIIIIIIEDHTHANGKVDVEITLRNRMQKRRTGY